MHITIFGTTEVKLWEKTLKLMNANFLWTGAIERVLLVFNIVESDLSGQKLDLESSDDQVVELFCISTQPCSWSPHGLKLRTWEFHLAPQALIHLRRTNYPAYFFVIFGSACCNATWSFNITVHRTCSLEIILEQLIMIQYGMHKTD